MDGLDDALVDVCIYMLLVEHVGGGFFFVVKERIRGCG